MRNNQNKRMRGRNNNNNNNMNRGKGQNPLTRVFESNGPDLKIRGTPNHIAEKYIQLARDAQSSGDPVAAENYYQHAEHYYRLIAAAQEQLRQTQPQFFRQEGEGRSDDSFDDQDDSTEGGYGVREPQPYVPREAQPYPPRDQQQRHHPSGQHYQPAPPQAEGAETALPSFITGTPQPDPASSPNGHEAQQPDRFPLHRGRRRYRGPRPDHAQGDSQPVPQVEGE